MKHAISVLTILLAAMLLVGSPVQAVAQIGSLKIVDQATEDPSFFSFRQRLLVALARRDSTFLMSHVAADVLLGFGGTEGRDNFRREWRPHEPESGIWSLLTRILAGGGTYAADQEDFPPTFSAPHIPFPDGLDPFEHVVVLAEGVRVREEPNLDGQPLGQVSFAALPLVRVNGDYRAGDDQDWVRIRLADGRVGYVHGDYTDSPIGYRARFEKRHGRWMLVMLLAGD